MIGVRVCNDGVHQCKYGIRSVSGGGRSSARETIGRVAAGAVAEQWLKELYQVDIVAWVSAVGGIAMDEELEMNWTRDDIDQSLMRCPVRAVSDSMEKLVREVKNEDDSIGGIVTVIVRNVPAGWGEPCFQKLESLMAHAMMSIPSTKGFEVGSGFAGTRQRGSQHNDMFVSSGAGLLSTTSNRSGGIQGGISNGQPIVMRVAFKPPATIARCQSTVDYDGAPVQLEAAGRHDPCVVPRAVPIVEAMAALVLTDVAMLQQTRVASTILYPPVGMAKPLQS